jgi:glycosyltransferase involved in cell wall biosynthesis
MACGVPAIASDVPGSADVLRGCGGGLLLPADDEVALAREVQSLLNDAPRRAQMGLQGRAAAEQRFAVEAVQAQIHAFYRGLI